MKRNRFIKSANFNKMRIFLKNAIPMDTTTLVLNVLVHFKNSNNG